MIQIRQSLDRRAIYATAEGLHIKLVEVAGQKYYLDSVLSSRHNILLFVQDIINYHHVDIQKTTSYNADNEILYTFPSWQAFTKLIQEEAMYSEVRMRAR